jgi:beta-lactam-binding protein with PASTA domain
LPVEPPSPVEPGSTDPAEPRLPAPAVPGPDGRIEVPDMAGWKRVEAEAWLGDGGLVPNVTLVSPPTEAQSGKVLGQSPRPGARVEPGYMVQLTVGDKPSSMTPVQPTPVQPTPVQPTPVQPTPVQPTPVQPTPVQPTPVQPTPVQPTPVQPTPVQPAPIGPVGPGGALAAVPDVVGLRRLKAEGLIRQAGFRYRVKLKETDYPADGTVLSQEPAPGERLVADGEIVLEVARTPPGAQVAVPGVVGQARDEAEAVLRDAGFLVTVTYGGGDLSAQGRVTAQAPVAGTSVRARSWVEIVVARGSGPAVVPAGGPPRLGPDSPSAAEPPPHSGALSQPPAVGTGPSVMPPPTPRGPAPLPPVHLPARDAERTARVPRVADQNVREAIGAVLRAGLLPIVEIDRTVTRPPGTVVGQSPEAETPALPGDLVRIVVSLGPPANDRYVNLPMSIGSTLETAQRLFAGTRSGVEVVQIQVPTHPYAGTGRVAAQYPVSSVPRREAARVLLWIVIP